MPINIIKIFITCFLFNVILHAETITANYKVSYGVFGEVGTAKAYLTKDEHNYTIEIELKSTGLAKILSKNRQEKHISKGHIENYLLISDSYTVIRNYGTKEKIKKYIANHENQTILKSYVKKDNGKVISQKSETMSYYSKNDLLTLYFNLDKLVKDKTKAQTYNFVAVGAERQSGKVTLVIPEKKDIHNYKEALGNSSNWYATAIIHQKIFESEEGKLLLGVGADGVTQQAVLKDVIFFGDIIAKKE